MKTNGTAAESVAPPPTALTARQQQLQSNVRAEAIERVLINGDLAQLSPADRINYYQTVCSSLNLNPLTKPFEYISLNGKLTLYAKRDATDQLRFRDRISIRITGREVIDDIYIVTAQARTPDGREDESTGAVSIAGLKGEAKSNQMMKAETKAKRRVTLSLCGLGLLDETEVDSIPGAKPEMTPREAQQAVAERKIAELQAAPKPVIEFPPASIAWQTRGQMKNVFAKLREIVGEVEYGKELERAGVNDASEFRYLNAARECYSRLVALAQQEVA